MLKILIPYRTLASTQSYLSEIVNNIVDALKTKTEVEIVWVVCMPDRLKSNQKIKSNFSILDIHDYNNAVEILEKEKPDLIFAYATHNFIDYAFSLAGKYLKIPVISHFSRTLSQSQPSITSNVVMFFQSSIVTDVEENQKQFMRRGRFFVYKYFFLLKTQHSIKMKKFQILKSFFCLIKIYMSNPAMPMYNQFANDLHWLAGEDLLEPLLKAGFDKHSLVVTGTPLYDKVFKKISEWKPYSKPDNKIHVLFAPGTLYEHGFVTKGQQFSVFKEIVKQISMNRDKLLLTIKIHPSSARLYDYQNLVKKIDPSVSIIQKGDFLDYLHTADVLVSFSESTVLTKTLIARKPIIIVNFADIKNDLLLKRGLALECKDVSKLIPLIHQAISSNPVNNENVEKFFKEIFYKVDGNASERICEAILKLLK